MTGRKTLLTPEVLKEASGLMRSGCFEKDVYLAMGIAKSTWYSWKDKGNTIETMLEGDVYKDSELDGNDRLFLDFLDMCRISRAKAINLNILLILKHAKTNWMAAKWYLEVVDPARFKPRESFLMEHFGKASLDHISPEDVARIRKELNIIFRRRPRRKDHPNN